MKMVDFSNPEHVSEWKKQMEVLRLTDDTEGFPGELQSSSPSSVAAAAACGPDPHHVLHPKHHDGHHLLHSRTQTAVSRCLELQPPKLSLWELEHLSSWHRAMKLSGSSAEARACWWCSDYQDVKGILWTLLIFSDGGEHWQNQAGENQQEPRHRTSMNPWKLSLIWDLSVGAMVFSCTWNFWAVLKIVPYFSITETLWHY